MTAAWIIDAVRTPIGRYAGALSAVRADDLGAIPMAALLERQAGLDPAAVDDVVYGCANQAGEDNRNVARMSALLAGLPATVPAATVNRLCGSGMNAIGNVADSIRSGGIEMAIAGGVESMSRAPFVMAKQTAAFGRNAEIHDTTLGWRFVNRKLEQQYGIDSMAETAENVADEFGISREDQDAFALRSQQRAEAAIRSGVLAEEIILVARGQAGVGIRAADHAEVIGIGAKLLLQGEAIFQGRTRVFELQLPLLLAGIHRQVGLVPGLVVGELVVG